jgi:hypothetical protein
MENLIYTAEPGYPQAWVLLPRFLLLSELGTNDSAFSGEELIPVRILTNAHNTHG